MCLGEQCFWMSMTHLVTIGYASIQPATRIAYMMAILEHFTGILLSSILLGIIVTKASIPSPRIIFSNVCLITQRNGIKHLIVRYGNTRGTYLIHPDIRLTCFKKNVTLEGESIFQPETLEINPPPVMSPMFNITHKITENSPIYDINQDQVKNGDFFICISIGGTDFHSNQQLYENRYYSKEEIVYNHRFVDIVGRDGDGEKCSIDFRKFHSIIPNNKMD